MQGGAENERVQLLNCLLSPVLGCFPAFLTVLFIMLRQSSGMAAEDFFNA